MLHLYRGSGFQSAVAHELISNKDPRNLQELRRLRFKALSRMSSFPTVFGTRFHVGSMMGFKALSRMSSFPTTLTLAAYRGILEFQSAVAHELISNAVTRIRVGWRA